MCLEGSLDELSIPDVLQIVALGRKTGWLSIDTPTAGGAIVFCRGRVFAAIEDEACHDAPGLARLAEAAREGLIRERIAASLDRFARSRSGQFSFQVSAVLPHTIGGRNVAAESLRSGLDVIDLLVDIACRQESSANGSAA
jgi:hypothetical protein